MTLYVDSSALVKRYVDEARSDDARRWLFADPQWVTANHTYPEVYRVISFQAPEGSLTEALDAFEDDWNRTLVVGLDDDLCRRAAALAVTTGTRTLDALHLAAAEAAGGRSVPFLTFDVRQATAARSLGFTVLGV
ncbi:MAG: type II toxin-antitoxin system VapC family toxin [Acidimicrobiia bacterium]